MVDTGSDAPDAAAIIINAASCSQDDVNAAISSASNGDIVAIPAGTCTYTTTTGNTPSVNINKAITVRGQTACTGARNTLSCTDHTIITDSTGTGFQEDPFLITASGARLSGLSVTGGTAGDSGELIGTTRNLVDVRIDHNHLTPTITTIRAIMLLASSSLSDHNWIGTADGGIDVEGSNNADAVYPGDYAWTQPLSPGSATCNYIEDNEFVFTSVLDGAWDSYDGARLCFRFNDVQGTNMGSHGLDSSTGRSALLQEVYNNTWANAGAAIFSWAGSRGGTFFIFNENVSGSGGSYNVYIDLREYREDVPYGWGLCDGADKIDQNTANQYGYPCRDQVGRGPESAPATDWPTNTSSPVYSEILSPGYMWGNTWKGGTPIFSQVNIANGSNCSNSCTPVTTHQILNNRDFYMEAASFNGTSGTGTGPLASRPSTCTAGVAYWATDQGGWNHSGSGGQGQLYQCSSTNTWTLYYTPYTYPHPLQGSGT